MIVDMRTYTAHAGKLGAFLEAYGKEGYPLQMKHLGNCVGYYIVDIGVQHRVVHFWQYENIGDRARRRANLEADPQWDAFRAKVMPLFAAQENRICKPAPYFPMKNPVAGPYPCVDLRIYTLQPGKLPEYYKIYQAEGLEPQLKHLGACLGYYGSDIGEQNQIVHFWGYKDVDDREKRRAAMFGDPAWMAYLGKARPLFTHQTNAIVRPAPFWSPK